MKCICHVLAMAVASVCLICVLYSSTVRPAHTVLLYQNDGS